MTVIRSENVTSPTTPGVVAGKGRTDFSGQSGFIEAFVEISCTFRPIDIGSTSGAHPSVNRSTETSNPASGDRDDDRRSAATPANSPNSQSKSERSNRPEPSSDSSSKGTEGSEADSVRDSESERPDGAATREAPVADADERCGGLRGGRCEEGAEPADETPEEDIVDGQGVIVREPSETIITVADTSESKTGEVEGQAAAGVSSVNDKTKSDVSSGELPGDPLPVESVATGTDTNGVGGRELAGAPSTDSAAETAPGVAELDHPLASELERAATSKGQAGQANDATTESTTGVVVESDNPLEAAATQGNGKNAEQPEREGQVRESTLEVDDQAELASSQGDAESGEERSDSRDERRGSDERRGEQANSRGVRTNQSRPSTEAPAVNSASNSVSSDLSSEVASMNTPQDAARTASPSSATLDTNIGTTNSNGVANFIGRLSPTDGVTSSSRSSGELSSDPTSELKPAEQRRLLNRVSRAFQLANARDGQIRLRLTPAELGSLKLELHVKDGVMKARLEAENQTAKTALLEQLPMLKDRLSEQGIVIESFDVDLRDESQSEQRLADERSQTGSERRESNRSSTTTRDGSTNASVESSETESSQIVSRLVDEKTLNVIV